MAEWGTQCVVALALIALMGCTRQGDEPLFVAQESLCDPVEPAPAEVTDIFATSCSGGGTGCHIAGGAGGGLDLDADVAAANLYGKAGGLDGSILVVGGDPDASYLIHKLIHDPNDPDTAPISGGKMPFLVELTKEQLQVIKDWISDLPACEAVSPSPPADVVEPEDEGPPPDSPEPTVELIPDNVADIFVAACKGCHVGGGQLGGLVLDKDVAAQNLINVDSQKTGVLLVKPGSAAESYLIDKMRARNIEDGTGPMPPEELLDDAQIIEIETWIDGLEDPGTSPPDQDTTQPPVECTPKNDKFKVSFGNVVTLIKTRCATAGCHDAAGAAGSGGLDMSGDTGDTFIANTVRVTAQQSDLLRIHPGNSADSYLMHKVQGTAGTLMPLDGTGALSAEDQEILSDWIDDCATKWAEEGISTEKP